MTPKILSVSGAIPGVIAVLLLAGTREPSTPKSEVQVRAEALMERARRFEDIRSKSAPAFQLKATFSFVGRDLEKAQGTYTEVWVSDSQWRRETVVNDLRRVEVGTANKIWTLDSSKDFPEPATHLPDAMVAFPATALPEVELVEENTAKGIAAECAITKPGPQQERYSLCFDKKSGALLQKVTPKFRTRNSVAYACFYGKFRKFGGFWFPREMACFEDKHLNLEAQIVELSAELSTDPSLFTRSPAATELSLFSPPPGATELGRCSVKPAPPVATIRPDPGFPQGVHSQESSVILSLIVDEHGKPQDVKVRQSGGKGFDEEAATTVQKWRFKPGTCDGSPISVEISVTFDFRGSPDTMINPQIYPYLY